jgi:hypothetical protein
LNDSGLLGTIFGTTGYFAGGCLGATGKLYWLIFIGFTPFKDPITPKFD